MSCKCATFQPDEGRYSCSVSGDGCMYMSPDSKQCAKDFGEGPDANNDSDRKPKTFEELDGEELCKWCPLPEESQGVHCYGGPVQMCEGRCCPEAYQEYLENFEEEN